MSSSETIVITAEEEGRTPSSSSQAEQATSSPSSSSSSTSIMSSSSSSPAADAIAAGPGTDTSDTTTTAAAATTAAAIIMDSSSRSMIMSSSSSKISSNSYFPINEDSKVFDSIQAEQLVQYGCKKVRRSGVIQTFKQQQQQQHSQQPYIVLKHSDLTLDECIGKGSFSSCYTIKSINKQMKPKQRLQQQPLLEASKVVVKVLRRKAMNDPRMFATCAGDLFKEALMLSTLNHTNVISVKAFGHGGIMAYKSGRHDAFFIVMERLEVTLSKRILSWQDQRNKLTFKLPSIEKSTKKLILLKEKTTTILQLADAIQYIHSQNIIHRDIKPDNVGYDLEGNLKVFDFDVARIIPPPSTSTTTATTSTSQVVSKASDSETSEESEALSSSEVTQPQPQQQPTSSSSSSSSLTQAFNNESEQDDDDPAIERFNNYDPNELFKLTQRIGSSRYMSPEVASGLKYNQKSDVYTFGLLVHEILTLEKPYEDIWSGYHEESVFIDGERPWINKKSWTPKLINIVESCWSQDIHCRPTMKEAYEQLKEELPNYIEYKTNKNNKSLWWLKLLTKGKRSNNNKATSDQNNNNNNNNKKQQQSNNTKVEVVVVEEETIVFST